MKLQHAVGPKGMPVSSVNMICGIILITLTKLFSIYLFICSLHYFILMLGTTATCWEKNATEKCDYVECAVLDQNELQYGHGLDA